MKHRLSGGILTVLSVVILAAGFACTGGGEGEMIPITTASEKARELYIKGRDLAENVRNQESIEYFEQALELDPNFAMAHLQLAFTSPSTRSFFEHFNAARALVDKVSEGERLWILGTQAAVNGDPARQRELFEEMVAAYPKDKRTHNQLANQLFGQQMYQEALAEYEKSRAIDPDYPPNYNQIGYCYRNLGDFEAAERAFQRYIELIPHDPNPYDSYAELLLKMGKFEASLEAYRKAVEINSRFLPSHFGIATNLCLMDKHKEAREGLYKQFLRALNDGQRRAILQATAVTYIDQEDYDQAFRELHERYLIAEANEDLPTMSNDLGTTAGILLMIGQADSARSLYVKSMQLIEASDLTEELKQVSRIGFQSSLAFTAWAKGDLETARTHIAEYHASISPDNVGLMQNYHALEGLVAMKAGDFQKAVDELRQTNPQNAIFLYYLGESYFGLGDKARAKDYIGQAAHYNSVNDLNYALIRAKALRRLAELESAT